MFKITKILIPFVLEPPLKTDWYEVSKNWDFETLGIIIIIIIFETLLRSALYIYI